MSGATTPPQPPATGRVDAPIGDPQSSDPNLRGKFIHSLAWTAGVRWMNQLLSWVATLVVARILSPEDFGLVSMATVYLGIVILAAEFGLGSAVITLRDISHDQIRQLNLAAVFVGVLSFGVSCAVAYPLSLFFRAPQLTAVIIVMSIGFVVNSFRSIPYSLMQRDMHFKRLAIIEGFQSLLLAGAMVAFALAGFRYWTLVIGNLLSALLSTGLTIAQRRCGFSWPRMSALKQAITFSQQVLMARLAWYVYSNADFFVAGRRLGKEPLGAYSLAWTLGSVPVEKISALIFNVTPAYFSAIQRDFVALRRSVLNLTEAISMLTFPLTLGLALVAHEFVLLALGPKWMPMVAPLRLLAGYAAVRSITPILPQILTVIGEVRFSMYVSLGAAVLLPAGFYVGSRWGIVGIAAAWMIVHPLILAPWYVRTFTRIGLGPGPYLRSLWPAVQSALAMCAGVLALRWALPESWPVGARAALLVVTGAGLYAGTLLGLHRSRVRALIRTVRDMRG